MRLVVGIGILSLSSLKSDASVSETIPASLKSAIKSPAATRVVDTEDDDLRREQLGKQRDPEWWKDPLALFDSENDADSEGGEDENYNMDVHVHSDETDGEPEVIVPLQDDDILDGNNAGQNGILNFDSDEQDNILDNSIVEQNGILDSDSIEQDVSGCKTLESQIEGAEEKNKDTNSPPLDVQRRLALHSILMKPHLDTAITQNKRTNNFSAPALPALLVLTKLRSMVPFVQPQLVTLFISLVSAQYIYTNLSSFRRHMNKNNGGKEPEPSQERDDEMDSSLPFWSKPFKRTPSVRENDEDDFATREEQQSSSSDHKHTQITIPAKQRKGWFLSRKKQNISIQYVQDLEDEIYALKERCEKVELDRKHLIMESDRLSTQLITLQTQTSTQDTTLRYLKSQLRDNQQQIKDAISKEKQKSEKEMDKVRDALIKVLQQERQLMRDQVKNTSAQVRALIKDVEKQEIKTGDQYSSSKEKNSSP